MTIRPTGPTALVLVFGAVALAAGVILCAFDVHDDAAAPHGCIPPVLAVLSALTAMPVLTTARVAAPSISGPARSIFLDTSTPPPRPQRA